MARDHRPDCPVGEVMVAWNDRFAEGAKCERLGVAKFLSEELLAVSDDIESIEECTHATEEEKAIACFEIYVDFVSRLLEYLEDDETIGSGCKGADEEDLAEQPPDIAGR